MNSGISIIKITAPIMLNVTWTRAARLAAIEPARAANIAVIVVPMLSPSRIGKATLAIPGPVLGGAMLAMFGMVISAGIKMLSHVDLNKQENMVIVAISLGM